MQTYNVALGDRAYPIHIGVGLLSKVELILPHLQQKRVALITNEVVAPLYLERIRGALEQAGINVVPVVLPDGEQHKNWATLNTVYDALLGARCERGTAIIALGGGVVGDISGFAAATYQRGVPFIQVPTTLLAQVDSSIGGKTAINHPLGKNMIGAFYQPRVVISDMETLQSLPERELKAGLAEIIKHGLIRDEGFFSWIEANVERILARDTDALAHAVLRSCEIKGAVVVNDERELGERALLNFGHTFGHAIENGFGYGTWLHGEAVAAGVALASDLSMQMGMLSKPASDRIRRLLARAGLPVEVKGIPSSRLRELMSLDKKARDGKLRFILLERIGSAIIRADIPPLALDRTLSQVD
ncbi:MAG: 3-dehydroquinate synthase [Betaproteobacteria bacterium RIFCSPLOWO2_02_FULL_62_17]|nr:MAG: 3-dehydroquinate synthase [Betaproteobacteria bacterium RIFCSPLOWO2_02_FULL_62_17]